MLRMMLMTAIVAACAAAQASVPKDATEIEPGVYKHTDSAGKTYKYKKTPFGVVKSADEVSKTPATNATPFGEVKSPAPAPVQAIKVSERGDSLDFERPSPFGSYKWTRKKAELTEAEREAWDRSRAKTTAASGPKE